MTTDTPSPKPKTEPTLASEVLALAQKIKAVRDIVQTRGSYFYDESILDLDGLSLQTAELQSEAKASFSDGVISAMLPFGVRAYATPKEGEAAPAQAEKKPLVQIEATFSLKYDLADTTEIRPEVLGAFANINGRFNLTAYWREFVAACASRAGFAPLGIPPYNAAQAIAALKAKPQPAPN